LKVYSRKLDIIKVINNKPWIGYGVLEIQSFKDDIAMVVGIHLDLVKIGLAKVEWLENQKGICRYNAEYLVKYIRVFRKKIRQMKKRLDKW